MAFRHEESGFFAGDVRFINLAATTISVGGHILDDSEWTYLDGQDQTVATTSTPTFVNLNLSGPAIITNADTTARDLTITTGAAKTLSLSTVVYDDLQFPTDTGKVPASNNPDWDASFTTNIGGYKFDVNDFLDLQSAEIPHNWVEGTAGDLHLHAALDGANATGGNRYAKFTIYVAISDAAVGGGGATWTEVGPYTAELTIPTGSVALKGFYLDVGDITLTGYKIGTQIKIRVKRIAATGGTDYADHIFVTQVGLHLQRNTIGSRSETTK